MKKISKASVVFSCIAIALLISLFDPGKTVTKKTDTTWTKIIDENGDGKADTKISPVPAHPFGGYFKSKPTAEDQQYFSTK